ncbi:MAG: NINE protein [Pirellulaceae bacterium]
MATAAWSTNPKNAWQIESAIPGTSTFHSAKPGNVQYVPRGYSDTHSKAVGYLFWLIGFTGAHRFYYGKPLTGILWFFTFGLLGVGWLIDFFLIPAMDQEADLRFAAGPTDYSVAWLLLVFAGVLGLHRFVQGRWFSGLVWLCTAGLFGIGIIYDVLTLNHSIDQRHRGIS